MQEIKDIQMIFEGMICYNSWFSQKSYEVHRLKGIDCQSIVKCYTKLVKIFPRETIEQGWIFLYVMLHMHKYINNSTDSGRLFCLHHTVPGNVTCRHVHTTMFQLVVWFGGRGGNLCEGLS